MSKENYGIGRGSLILASLHQNFKTFLMDIPEKLDSARIVYTLGIWAPGGLESWRSDSDAWCWKNWTLALWLLGPKKLTLHFTVKSAVADYDIFNSRF